MFNLALLETPPITPSLMTNRWVLAAFNSKLEEALIVTKTLVSNAVNMRFVAYLRSVAFITWL